MYGMDANFMRAQRAYDAMEPPGWDAEETEYKECGAEVAPPEDGPEDAPYTECPFAGDVDVNYAGWTAYWTCPTCATEVEEDCEPDPPERDYYDD